MSVLESDSSFDYCELHEVRDGNGGLALFHPQHDGEWLKSTVWFERGEMQ